MLDSKRDTPVLRRHALALAAFLLLTSTLPHAAQADPVVIDFTGTVQAATLDLGGVLVGGESISGTLIIEDGVSGTFTPSPNPTFVRAEMLYVDAATSLTLTVDGSVVSGTGGDVELFDSTGALSGDDSYEVTSNLTTGTVAGVPVQSLFWNSAYPQTGFSLTSGTTLFAPPAFDGMKFNQFTLTGVGPNGGIAFGSIDGFTVQGSSAVPSASPGVLGLLAVALSLLGAGWVGRAGARHGPRSE